jgi:hypothetical protein
MPPKDVILIEIGKPAWPRFMIFHTGKNRYWDKGRWSKGGRNGELWHRKAEAEAELQFVRLASPEGK